MNKVKIEECYCHACLFDKHNQCYNTMKLTINQDGVCSGFMPYACGIDFVKQILSGGSIAITKANRKELL